MSKRFGKVLAYGVLGAATFAGVGKGIDTLGDIGIGNRPYVYGYDTHDLKTAQVAVADSQAYLAKANLQASALQEKVGEGCAEFLAPYIGIGEGLFDTSAVDGIVISDALAESSEPCGNSQSTIRFAYADLIASNREVHNAEAAVTRTKLNEADFKERIADDADFSGAKAGGVFGLVVGVIAGLVVTRRKSEVDSTHPVQRTPVQRIEVTSDTPAVAPFLKAMSKPD